MLKNARNFARKYGAKIGTAATLAAGTAVAQAQAAANGLTLGMDTVDLAGVGVKVGAVMVLVVGLAMYFKGADLGKRVVRKV
ncbi:hypothetical protein [Xylophilus ampelinus]|uniref:Virion coat protein B n=1 Tax=Xylophilus ampelinus TaxID=54067 RepID=A0A318SCY3_9BURK|nr:hypothetical protein [Xylophilus ampelinus]MCS4511879.1 hypothetical protein [Xylophilus ampelinus]PYE73017.1 hypothetical protein DFQ15_1415 [Xylophilus ampelinus]